MKIMLLRYSFIVSEKKKGIPIGMPFFFSLTIKL